MCLPKALGIQGLGATAQQGWRVGPECLRGPGAVVRPFLLSWQAQRSDVPEAVSMPGLCWARSIPVTSEGSRPSWWSLEDAHLLRPGGWRDESRPLSLKLPEQGRDVHGSDP